MSEDSIYIVLGGEVTELEKNLIKPDAPIDIAGVYRDYNEALKIWRSRAQATVDNAHMRYFIIPIHEYLLKD